MALLFATLLLYAVLGLTATFAADDYCQAAIARQYGLFGSVGYTYATWSGRFSQTFLSGGLYLVFDRAAPLVGAVLCISTLAAVTALRWGRAGLVLSVTFVAALGENIWQGLYWLPGGMTYLVPLVLMAVVRKNRTTEFALAFAISGFNESAGLVVILAGVLYRRPLILLGALVGTLLVLAAPGNAVRAAFFERQGLMETAFVTGVVLSRFLTGLLVSVPVALLGALVAGMMRPAGFDRRLVILCLAALVVGIAPTLYLSGAVTPRTLVLPTAAVIGLCFHIGQVLGTQHAMSRQLQYAAVVLLLLGAMEFTQVALGRSFVERAGVEDTTVQWVADCANVNTSNNGIGVPYKLGRVHLWHNQIKTF